MMGGPLPRESLLIRESAIKASQVKAGLKKDPWTSLSFVRFVQLMDFLCCSESFGKEIHRLESAAEAFNCAIRPPSASIGRGKSSAVSHPYELRLNTVFEHTIEPKKVMAALVRMIQSHLNILDMDKLYFPSQNFVSRYEFNSQDPSSCEDSLSLQHLRGGIVDDPEVSFTHPVLVL